LALELLPARIVGQTLRLSLALVGRNLSENQDSDKLKFVGQKGRSPTNFSLSIALVGRKLSGEQDNAGWTQLE
jgi:hypothetical protein